MPSASQWLRHVSSCSSALEELFQVAQITCDQLWPGVDRTEDETGSQTQMLPGDVWRTFSPFSLSSLWVLRRSGEGKVLVETAWLTQHPLWTGNRWDCLPPHKSLPRRLQPAPMTGANWQLLFTPTTGEARGWRQRGDNAIQWWTNTCKVDLSQGGFFFYHFRSSIL